MKKITTILLSTLLIGSIALATGCGSSGTASNTPSSGSDSGQKEYTIKLPGVGSGLTSIDSVSIAIEKGFFKEQNIKIENVGNINIPQYVAAISSGTIDGALLMASDGVAAIDNGAGFIEVATGRDSVEGNPHMTYVTLKDNAGISRGKDLVGKKVGVSSKLGCTAGFPLEYAAQDGVENPLNSISFVVAQEVTLVDALRKGSVDVVGLHLPEAVINKLYPDVKVLFTDNTILQDRGGDIGWFFPKKFVDANPEAIKGFVTAIAKANDWINANPEEAKELYWKINPNVNKDTFVINHFAEHGLIQESHVQIWLDVLGSGKSIQTLKNKWTFDQIATNKYNPNAK